jgi:hypothetical protein
VIWESSFCFTQGFEGCSKDALLCWNIELKLGTQQRERLPDKGRQCITSSETAFISRPAERSIPDGRCVVFRGVSLRPSHVEWLGAEIDSARRGNGAPRLRHPKMAWRVRHFEPTPIRLLSLSNQALGLSALLPMKHGLISSIPLQHQPLHS